MNEERMQAGYTLANLFLDTLPEEYSDKILRAPEVELLSYFWCWCEEMKEECTQ